MIKSILAAAALGLAVPAFANQGDARKDAQDKAKDAVDNAKDKLHTDSGLTKAKRHAKKMGRDVSRQARHSRNDVKKKIHDATK